MEKNIIRQTIQFKETGECRIGNETLSFGINWSAVNDKLVRVGDEKGLDVFVYPSCGHLPEESELALFNISAKSWSIPEGGVFVLRDEQSKVAAVQLLNINRGEDGYNVEFEYTIY